MAEKGIASADTSNVNILFKRVYREPSSSIINVKVINNELRLSKRKAGKIFDGDNLDNLKDAYSYLRALRKVLLKIRSHEGVSRPLIYALKPLCEFVDSIQAGKYDEKEYAGMIKRTLNSAPFKNATWRVQRADAFTSDFIRKEEDHLVMIGDFVKGEGYPSNRRSSSREGFETSDPEIFRDVIAQILRMIHSAALKDGVPCPIYYIGTLLTRDNHIQEILELCSYQGIVVQKIIPELW